MDDIKGLATEFARDLGTWQSQIDDIQRDRLELFQRVEDRWQDFILNLGQVSFGLAGVVGPLMYLSDSPIKFPAAIFAGFLLLMANGMMTYGRQKLFIDLNSHGARGTGLDLQLSLVRMRSALRRLMVFPEDKALRQRYEKVVDAEVKKIQSTDVHLGGISLFNDLAISLLVLGCYLFASQLWPWGGRPYALSVGGVGVVLLAAALISYRFARPGAIRASSLSAL
jgi:hypothetical protein